MSLASLAWDAEQLSVSRPGGRIAVYTRHEPATVIAVDFCQPQTLPSGATSLEAFLDEFESHPQVWQQMPAARRSIASRARGLASLRLAQGLSQKELANALGTSQSRVSMLENRQQKAGEDTLRQLSNILLVDFNTLMAALDAR